MVQKSARLSMAVGGVMLITQVFVSQVAMAGSVLRLNAGSLNTQEIQKSQMSVLSHSTAKSNFIVQFKTAITAQDRAALKAAGFSVFGYLPDDALVVRASAQEISQFQNKNNRVQGIVQYDSSFKLSSNLDAASVFNKDRATRFTVRAFSEADASAAAAQLAAKGYEVQGGGKTLQVVAPRAAAFQMAAMVEVEHVQATPEMSLFHFAMDEDLKAQEEVKSPGDFSDLSGFETGTKVMKFDAAWAQGFTGKGQVVGVADTGLDSGNASSIHTDFTGAVASGYPFGLWSRSWEDPMGHGTHVAGSVASRGSASKGLLKGGAYDAQLVAEGMWSPMMKNLTVPAKLGDLFTKAYADGARIHTNSWGGARQFGAYDSNAIQVDEWMWANPDMTILFAAGNSGTDKNKDGRIDSNSMASPGTAKNIITVGASENKVSTGGIQVPISKLRAGATEWGAEPIYSSYISDNENGMSMFSSRGPTTDGRTKPDVVAPGTNILSNKSHAPGAEELWGAYNPDYVWSGGTSMSTPLTAGAVAVARQVVQEKWKISNPSGALMKAVMVHTAVDMFPGQYGEGGAAKGQELLTRRPNSDEGYGRVDVSNIVALAGQTKMIDNTVGVAQGAEVVYEFDIAAGSLYANLVWTDAPGSPNAALALVNDLDLVLVQPDGSTLSMNDHLNNLEVIEKINLPAGKYKLVVKGFKVPQGRNGAQPYALIYTAK